MCSHFENVRSTEVLTDHFKIRDVPSEYSVDCWPGYTGLFLTAANEPQFAMAAHSGVFGMIPAWAKDPTISRYTYNARVETVSEKPSFRDSWNRHQRCLVPAQAIYEPDWRSGQCTPTRISRTDHHPLMVAGLWSQWLGPSGVVHSFTLLTINAEEHRLMNQFHRPTDEKRMIACIDKKDWEEWLCAQAHSSHLLRAFDPDDVQTTRIESRQKTLF
jgi:putative SOS response-associated peptidase YedK